MKRCLLVGRMCLGGGICGSVFAVFAGGMLGVVFGNLTGDFSPVLGVTLFAGGLGGMGGAVLGLIFGFREDL